ncbi:hypothetical protein N7478_003827 [Penicillium angulare]|uniref:uncharacterized protein n=1 Tax=Penicillium angulare TaxID=116970 RepID=UPI0025412990|nr:uncharacterized protein N7478_003827 [Penicillium angulare]KAJ5288141.1 hypothetical protein N7478_003827 [Penicillium angulare]
MTSHKRPRQVTLSSEETHSDDPLDDTDSEWERITEDPVKRVAFERKCIEDELTNQKRVILLQENPSRRSHCRFWDCVPRKLNGEPNIRSAFRFNVKDLSGRYYVVEPNKYYHVSCMEQIFPDLSSLGRTFEVDIYDRFRRAHAKWDRKDNTVEINHQLGDHEGSRQDCEKCEEVPHEPLRKDYFPEEPRSSLLSEVLASVVGVGHLDELDGDLNARRCKKIRRS